jgi:hypothetical protein
MQRKSLVHIVLTLVLVALYGWQTYTPPVVRQNPQIQQTHDIYVSPAGLRYGDDPSPRFVTRIDHIMAHTQMDAQAKKHSVFVVKEKQALLDLLDEAWKKRGTPLLQEGKRPRDAYDIAMGRVIGTKGQKNIRIITEFGTSDIVTAYPVFDDEIPSSWGF